MSTTITPSFSTVVPNVTRHYLLGRLLLNRLGIPHQDVEILAECYDLLVNIVLGRFFKDSYFQTDLSLLLAALHMLQLQLHFVERIAALIPQTLLVAQDVHSPGLVKFRFIPCWNFQNSSLPFERNAGLTWLMHCRSLPCISVIGGNDE